ncbi:hypothetical protein [Roseibium litorale]|uniref:RecA/RadA family phage recombinase n=1 Tax=Roseibium litorale TaxID=2803841 RepID=A0ABR9CKP0_9HYPH|nr:hypothetical protein [Roseibium litorale]MBD8890906.1 hypothetical protein [Roseibium litorale]
MLSKMKNIHRRVGRQVAHPVAAGAKIFGGGLVVLEGGFAKPGYTATNLIAAGMADASADNSSGAAGAITVTVSRDDWVRVPNDIGDPVTRASINQPCFIVDDETVAATDGGGTRSEAGTVRDLDDGGVWIEFA